MTETDSALRPETAAPEAWRDWRWQMRHRVDSPEALAAYVRPTPDEAAALEATRDVFRWNVGDNVSTRYNALSRPELDVLSSGAVHPVSTSEGRLGTVL